MIEKKVKALIPTGFGLNCDNETAYCLELAGADVDLKHLNELFEKPEILHDYQIMALGGGFSWADDHGAGLIQARRMQRNLGKNVVDLSAEYEMPTVPIENYHGKDLYKFIEDGKLIIGICNGAQTVLNLGILPGFDSDYKKQSVAFTYNDCGNFRDQWVGLKVNPKSNCVFTKDVDYIKLPVRHGEGKFITDEETLGKIMGKNQYVMQYSNMETKELANRMYPVNPNGSINDIAGICDPTGRIFALMPHPEAFNHATNDPIYTRKKYEYDKIGKEMPKEGDGVKIFRNAVEFARENLL